VFFAPKYGFGIRRTRLFWVVLSDYIPPTNGNIYLFLVTAIVGMAAHTDAFSGRLAAMHSYPILFNSEQPSHKFGARL
jgi:hypothetical protein